MAGAPAQGAKQQKLPEAEATSRSRSPELSLHGSATDGEGQKKR
jgi:hypothetical protein